MIIRILLAGILGGALLFGWGAAAHEVLPIGLWGFSSVPNEEAIVSTLQGNMAESGMFMLPSGGLREDLTTDQLEEAKNKISSLWKTGPHGILVYVNHGEDIFYQQLATQGGICVLSALLASLLLAQASPALPRYLSRVLFVTLLGMLAAVVTLLPFWNWYRFPADFVGARLVEHTAGFLIAGLLMAALIRRPAVAPPPPTPPKP
jgi:hypothetical protein